LAVWGDLRQGLATQSSAYVWLNLDSG